MMVCNQKNIGGVVRGLEQIESRMSRSIVYDAMQFLLIATPVEASQVLAG